MLTTSAGGKGSRARRAPLHGRGKLRMDRAVSTKEGRMLRRRLALLSLTMLLLSEVLRPAASTTAQVLAAQTETSLVYHAGWNLVGAPAGTHFGDAGPALFALRPGDADYVALPREEGVVAGEGYWAFFATDTRVALAGASGSAHEVDAPAGTWFLAGNPGVTPARVSGADIAYTYDPVDGYQSTDLLSPGRGAFVYSAAGGAIEITPVPDTIRALATAPSVGMSQNPVQAGLAAGTVRVLASGFGQPRAGGAITAGILLRNTGTLNLDMTPVTITSYDAAGSVIAAADAKLHLIRAGETTALVQRLAVREAGATAARVEVQTGEGRPAGDPPPGTLSFSQVTLVPGRAGLQASAILTSTYTFDLSAVHISALAYDAAGKIIGGGTGVKRLVPAGASTGVLIPVEAGGSPARLELYAQLP